MQAYASAMRYRTEVMYKFYSPALTHELTYLPYFYYQLVSLYEDFGGQRKEVDQVLQQAGITYEQLQTAFESYSQSSSGQGGYSMQDFALQIIEWCEDVVRLQQMSPDEYAAQRPEILQEDSILEGAIQMYLDNGGSEDELKKSEAYNKVDRKRSERLYKETGL